MHNVRLPGLHYIIFACMWDTLVIFYIVEYLILHFKRNDYAFRGGNSLKMYLSPLIRVYSERKEFSPLGSKFFLFWVDPFFEGDCRQESRRGLVCRKAIMKTYHYNFDPLKPLFYIVKLGEAVLMSTHNLSFEQKYEKYQNFYLKTFSFWWWNFQYIWIGVFS